LSNYRRNRRGHAQEEAKWLRNSQLAEYLNVSAMCIWRWQRDPEMDFPKPSVINGLPYTDVSAIDAWMRNRVVDLADAGRKAKAKE
jgi:predicted DNA-binding transcriptional regulator AlpA